MGNVLSDEELHIRDVVDGDSAGLTLTEDERLLVTALYAQTRYQTGVYSIRHDHPCLDGVHRTCPSDLDKLARSAGAKIGHGINVFEWGGQTWVGFEYRRRDYERDEERGTNAISKLVAKGHYGTFERG